MPDEQHLPKPDTAPAAEADAWTLVCACGRQVRVRSAEAHLAIRCHGCGALLAAAPSQVRTQRAGEAVLGHAAHLHVVSSGSLRTPPGRTEPPELLARPRVRLLLAATGICSLALVLFLASRKAPTPSAADSAKPGDLYEPAISQTAIRRLVSDPDPRQALGRALLWQQALSKHSLAKDDRRPRLLNVAIRQLKRKLMQQQASSPPQQLTTDYHRYQALLEQAAAQLSEHRLQDARRMLDAAATLRAQHHDDPAFGEGRLQRLRQLLAEREQQLGELQPMLHELQQAMAALDERDLLPAWRRYASAVQRIRLSLATAVQRAVLREQVSQARLELSLACGVRCLREAHLAIELRNVLAAHRRLLAARMYLEGLPVDRVQDLLKDVAALHQKLEPVPSSTASDPLSDHWRLRDELERLYDLAAAGELVEMARHAVRLADDALDLPPLTVSAWQPPVADYQAAAAEAVARALRDELDFSAMLPTDAALARQRRAAVAAALDELLPWQHADWWQALAARVHEP